MVTPYTFTVFQSHAPQRHSAAEPQPKETFNRKERKGRGEKFSIVFLRPLRLRGSPPDAAGFTAHHLLPFIPLTKFVIRALRARSALRAGPRALGERVPGAPAAR